MFLHLLQAASVAAAIMAEPTAMSEPARTAIAPVAAAISQTRAKHAAMPPATTDAQRLVRMGELDAAPRVALSRIDFSKVPAADRRAAMAAIWQQIIPIDRANQTALMAMHPEGGWFTKSRYGNQASNAAYLIVQHSNVDLWRRYVPVLEPLARSGEIEPDEYAKMFDRLAQAEGRKQRYGTQMTCEAGKWIAGPLEDPAKVDAFRASISLKTTFAQNLARFANRPPC